MNRESYRWAHLTAPSGVITKTYWLAQSDLGVPAPLCGVRGVDMCDRQAVTTCEAVSKCSPRVNLVQGVLHYPGYYAQWNDGCSCHVRLRVLYVESLRICLGILGVKSLYWLASVVTSRGRGVKILGE